jgi:hypothetical protein
MAGVFLIAVGIVAAIWELRAGTHAETAVQLRRYLQLWTGSTMAITWGMLASVGWLRWRPQDQHSAFVGAMCLTHLGVTVVSLHAAGMAGSTMHERIGVHWGSVDGWATGLDSLIYMTWALTIPDRRGASNLVVRQRPSGTAESVLPFERAPQSFGGDTVQCKGNSLPQHQHTTIL